MEVPAYAVVVLIPAAGRAADYTAAQRAKIEAVLAASSGVDASKLTVKLVDSEEGGAVITVTLRR